MANWFARSFGGAVNDVRQRLLEEAWFGKAVTPRSQTITLGSPEEKSPGEQLGWSRPEAPEQAPDLDR